MCRVLGDQPPNLGEIIWSFSLASDGFLAASHLISNSSALWKSEKAMEAGVLPTRNGGQQGLYAQESHEAVLCINGLFYAIRVFLFVFTPQS